MKTKNSEDFLKQAQKKPRTKFAVVGKGTTWTIYEGSDLSKATPGEGEQLIKATCQKSQAKLKVFVVGGSTEMTVLKTKVFPKQVKENAKAFEFKVISGEENGELEKLQFEVDGPLVEQVGKLPVQAQQQALPLLNQAKKHLEEGEIGAAKAKVAELKRSLGGKSEEASVANDQPGQGPSSGAIGNEQAQRSSLLAELQGPLVGQVAAVKGETRAGLIKDLNQAMKLAKEGDLEHAKLAVDTLKNALGSLAPSRPKSEAPPIEPKVAFKNQLIQVSPSYQDIIKKNPINKSLLEQLMKEAVGSGKNNRFETALATLASIESEVKVGKDFVALRDETDLAKKIQLCESFLQDHKDHSQACSAVEDLYAEARKEWGISEATKAYASQMKKEDSQYNPGNKFDPQFYNPNPDPMEAKLFDPVKIKQLADDYGLEEAEVIAIRTYTASNYKYMNPAVANQKDHPERQKEQADGKKLDWMAVQQGPDLSKVTDPTERERLKQEWAKSQKARDLSEEGALHAGMVMQAFKKLPKKTGPCFRGARMNMSRFNSEYQVGKKFPIEAFVSQSTDAGVAQGFADNAQQVDLPQDADVSVFVECAVADARDVSEMSVYGGENEWLLPPGGFFEVLEVEVQKNGNKGYKPEAKHWRKVKMKQVPK